MSRATAIRLSGRVGNNDRINGVYVQVEDQVLPDSLRQSADRRPVFYNQGGNLVMFYSAQLQCWVISEDVAGTTAPAIAQSTARHPLDIQAPWRVAHAREFQPDPNIRLEVHAPTAQQRQPQAQPPQPAQPQQHHRQQKTYRLSDVINSLITHEERLIKHLALVLDKFARDTTIMDTMPATYHSVLFGGVTKLYTLHTSIVDRLKETSHASNKEQIRLLQWLKATLESTSPPFVFSLPLVHHTANIVRSSPLSAVACPALPHREAQLGVTVNEELSRIGAALASLSSAVNIGHVPHDEVVH
ncbi:hypothetical protein PTSG_05308 [Salpingoeca rosetta]|uniref:Uncharacterized protein n=1 Tax=Salpingoeca rosetta (strain ATCC 50818 / BSB-021) TaxID=946362 RepID=F2UA23_SALR5|nr:uncharacterized protein PTSG_05308 [Salpingoeca rosetta]EGD73598.1 hypothetical protein PTSG_05308 [Salpingoeca rosetta]|eukprot:XP_004993880.1 hypothetical protein PTSG_05308 [Salpingoeca rosetta]